MTQRHIQLPHQSRQRTTAALNNEPIPDFLSSPTESGRVAHVIRASTSTCTPGSNSPNCQSDDAGGNDMTVAITLGIIIPLFFAFILCFFLHRRYQKRQELEDANDKHKSLDFGLDETIYEKDNKSRRSMKKSSQVQQSMDGAEEIQGRNRGISFDLGSPYFLPPMLQDSRGSLHSLSRSSDVEGPYHSVHLVRSPDLQSLSRSPMDQSRPASTRKDSSSVNTASTDTSILKKDLVHHPQKPATATVQIYPDSSTSSASSSPDSSPIPKPEPAHIANRKPKEQQLVTNPVMPRSMPYLAAAINADMPAATPAVTPAAPSPRLVREGTDQKGAFVLPPRSASVPHPQLNTSTPIGWSSPPAMSPVSTPRQSPVPSHGWRQANQTPRTPASPTFRYDDVTYADVLGIAQKPSTRSPPVHDRGPGFPTMPTIPEPGSATTGLGLQYEDAYQRADQVRSFYREYFEDPYSHGPGYLDGAAIFDPETGGFVIAGAAPWHEPITRRAMTPPPRAPPRNMGSRSSSLPRHGSRVHHGRAYSSASGHPAMGGRGRAMMRPIPRPGPLTNLPTPHLLKDDSTLLSAIDFAPPLSYKDRQAGRTNSPFNEQKPYAPRVPAFAPLASSFDNLPVLPTPHALRKSGSFTALDFAPPARFRRPDGNSSDSGSVRSGRSNRSAAQVANIRAGAYRVSRIPKEFVGTRDDFALALKPQWDMRT